MRKYQQLLLLIVSCFSCAILLIYKNENTKLKYILQVVNFFSRNDAALLRRFENDTKGQINFVAPLPVWQVIGNSFHAYAAYWNHNELLAGGEAIVIVAGKQASIIDFRCFLIYDGGDRTVQGKFHFQRVDDIPMDSDINFTNYNFFCRLSRDFGKPDSIAFMDIASSFIKTFQLKLRHIKTQNTSSIFVPRLATICVDFVNFNSSLSFGKDQEKLLQFFLHHHILGIQHFIVYNGDQIPYNVQQRLQRTNVQLHSLPFNFPFVTVNARENLRRIIQRDCVMRNINFARTTILLEPNEFLYLNTKLKEEQSVFRSIHHYTPDITRFEVAAFTICMDQSRLLIDNILYDPQEHSNKIFIYRSHVPISTILLISSSRSITLPLSMVLAHRYIKCSHGSRELYDWRSSIREDFMENLQLEREELLILV